MANTALSNFAGQNQGNLEALSHFIVDNNTTAVYAVLRSNGFTFNTPGEASIIVRSLLTSNTPTDISTVAQLSTIPYINSATNGTGGMSGAPSTGMSTLGAGDDLLCLGSKLFGLSIGCPTVAPVGDAAVQAAALKAAQEKEAAQQKVIYWTIGIAAVVILVLVIYFTKKETK